MKHLLALCVVAMSVTTGAAYGQTYYDASQFGKSDICLSIQAAIAALPSSSTLPATAGMVIDARNFRPVAPATTLACTINPFTLTNSLNQGLNPIVLVNMGNASTTPGSQGGVLLLPGYTITTDVPWLVPSSWSVVGQGATVTVLAPSSTFSNNLQAFANNGVSGTGGGTNYQVTGNTAPMGWTNNMVGMIFTACSSFAACSATSTSFSSATVVGIVTQISPSASPFPTLNLGSPLQVTLAANSHYVLQAPVMAWATTAPCTSACSGQITNTTNTGGTVGSVIQDIGLDCTLNGVGVTTISGCIPFWDQYGQERSQLKRLRISGFTGLGLGIYTGSAQNGGPFEDLQMVNGPGGIASGATCVEVGGTDVGGPPLMRGIRGLTCTNVTNAPSTTFGIGVDINTQNFALSDAHFEDFSVGVQVGALRSARGISISDITGGSTGKDVETVVLISPNCPSASGCGGSFGTSDIEVQNVYQPSTTPGVVAFRDGISGTSGNVTSEPNLGLYNLGDGVGLNNLSTRQVLTTSSSFGSSPSLLGMTPAGTPISGVQGTTGTLVQMSTGTVASGDFASFDGNGNNVDSQIGSFAIGTANSGDCGATTTGCGGMWLPTINYPIATPGTTTVVGTAIKAMQFVVPTKITFTRITIDVGTSSGGSFDIGIYNATAGSKLVETGNVTCSSGAQSVSVSSTTLQPGVYFLAYAATDSTCALVTLPVPGTLQAIMNKVATRMGTAGTFSGAPLPSSLTISAAAVTPTVVLIEP